MIAGLDTSVVIRLIMRDPPELATRALAYVQELQEAGDSLRVSDWVIAEVYYALQYHYQVSKQDAIEALKRFTASPGILATKELLSVLATPELASANPGFMDRMIHLQYLPDGVAEVATFEKAARKLPHVRVL